jgi:hypothetical protein
VVKRVTFTAAWSVLGLQMEVTAANTMKEQFWSVGKERSCSLGVEWGLTSPHRKIPACYEMLHKASDLRPVVNMVMNLLVP